MKSASKLGIVLVAVTSFVFLVAGCSMTYRPRIYPIPPDLYVEEYQGRGEPITIKNEANEGVVPIEKILPIGPDYISGDLDFNRYYTDLRQVTDATASLLAEELSERGFSLRGDASKSITLNVTGIYLLYEYPEYSPYQCVIETEYTTSDGHNQTVRAGQSSDHYADACNGAIVKGVVNLLNDVELIEFLTKRVP